MYKLYIDQAAFSSQQQKCSIISILLYYMKSFRHITGIPISCLQDSNLIEAIIAILFAYINK